MWIERILRSALVAGSYVIFAAANASAQVLPLSDVSADGASAALTDSLRSHKHLDVKPVGDSSVPPPITDSDATKPAFLPPVITYRANIATNYAEGPTGSIRGAAEGTVDAAVTVRVNPRTRLAVAYYQISANPLGSDTGVLPIAIQGRSGTVTNEQLQARQPDPSTKVEILAFAAERLFTIHNSPLVATFAYEASDAFFAGKRSPLLEYYDGKLKSVLVSTAQNYNLLVSEPFVFDDQRLLVVFNQQIQQTVHTAGFNEAPNRPQLEYSAFFTYDANDKATFFFEPAKAGSYFPTDRYPQHQAVFVYGVAYKLHSPFFVQASVTNLTTTNPDYDGTGRIGVTHVTVPCPPNLNGPGVSAQCARNAINQTLAPTIGGAKLATIQLSVGFGTPPIFIPF